MRLKTDRLLLRDFEEKDLPQMLNYLGDPDVMQYIEPPFQQEQVRQFLQQCGLVQPPLVYALEEVSSGRLAGHVIFHPFEGRRCYELGWILGKDFQGKGYALEISRELLRYAAETLRLVSVVLESLPENLPSLRLIQKLGAVPAGAKDGLLLFRISFPFYKTICNEE